MAIHSDVASSDFFARSPPQAAATALEQSPASPDFDIENGIRIAAPDDFQEIFRLCCMLHEENGAHAFSEWKARHLIWRGVNRDNAIVGVIGPSDNIKGLIYLSVDPVYYSDDDQLVELWAYVRPDCRRSDYAKRLIRFAKQCSEATGLHLVIGVISNDRLAAKQRLYEREMPKGGVFYIFKPTLQADAGQE